jgi:hypothetical protein
VTVQPPLFRHLSRLTNATGIVEHAHGDRPRTELEYATDDAGRLLALASSTPREPDARRLATIALQFLQRAYCGGGCFQLRLGADDRWTDDAPSDDATGRAIYGLGVAASVAPWPTVRDQALGLFVDASQFRSEHPRATAYAVLGADALLTSVPFQREARTLTEDAHETLPHKTSAPWAWPEARLTYANALLPDALLAVGARRGDALEMAGALKLLDWLVVEEWRQSAFSFAPVGGRGPQDRAPGFDQQPIEAWAMADACARAFQVTGKLDWADACVCAASWFRGRNDTGIAMFDAVTGGGYDGLTLSGVNANQGAESTMAFVAATTVGRRAARRLPIPLPARVGERCNLPPVLRNTRAPVIPRPWIARETG